MRKLRRVVPKYQLGQYTGLGETENDGLIKNDPTFPKGFTPKEGGRAKVFFEDELAEWQEQRAAAERDAANT